MNAVRPRASHGSQSSVNSMMSSAVTSAGASDRDIRNRSGLRGVPHRDVPRRIEDTLVGENAARGREVLERRCVYFHGITDT